MGLLATASAHKVATAVLAGVVVAGGAGVQALVDDGTTATVTKIVDGDTIDVRYDGDEHRVRLLNIDTPESVDPDEPVECLAPEASEFLAAKLPVGTTVRLERDEQEEDSYGRELAAVFLGDVLVNAEIARAGYGVPMSVAPNTKFLPQVEAAHAEAEAAQRGLYSPSTECTLPAQVGQVEEAAIAAAAEVPAPMAPLADFDSFAAELAAAVAIGESVAALLDGDRRAFPLLAHTPRDIDALQDRVETRLTALATAQNTNRTARAAEKKRLDDIAWEAARKAAEEAARKAAEEAARRAAEEAAAQAAREAAQRQAPRRPSTSGSSSGTAPKPSGGGATRTAAPQPPDSGSGSSGGPAGYTGCRSYAPGGKTWTPIPC
jgi:micrococcal nuclease